MKAIFHAGEKGVYADSVGIYADSDQIEIFVVRRNGKPDFTFKARNAVFLDGGKILFNLPDRRQFFVIQKPQNGPVNLRRSN